MNKVILNPVIVEMLRESNYIEEEFGEEALEDAIKAWEFARENDDISFEWLLEIHRLLMQRLNPRIAGKLRDGDVWIGGRHCRFISHGLLKENTMEAVNRLNLDPDLYDKEEKETLSKSCHIHFECVHPFFDGNGRTGRILYNIHRLKLGLPIHVIKEEEKLSYYQWFQ
jgi:fido (protein-threonine AMPylation protein)